MGGTGLGARHRSDPHGVGREEAPSVEASQAQLHPVCFISNFINFHFSLLPSTSFKQLCTSPKILD